MENVNLLKPSINLARFQTYFYKVSRTAFTDPADNVLKIGLNHTNQDIEPFTQDSTWDDKKIFKVWRADLYYECFRLGKWLQGYKVEQRHYDVLIDLLTDDVFKLADFRPHSLIELIKYGSFDAAADQFLRWVVDLEGQVSMKHIKRAFARRAYFKGEDYLPFTFAKVSPLNIETLNDAIEREGYCAIENENTGLQLVRLA